MILRNCLARQRLPTYYSTTNYCTDISSSTKAQQTDGAVSTDEATTLTQRFTNLLANATAQGRKPKQPDVEVYKPRIDYIGFLRKNTWHYTPSDATHRKKSTPSVYWKKFTLFMGFSGTNYMGMQYNPNVPTIEDSLFIAMLKNNWVTEYNMKNPHTVEFQRGSRTDRGVSAARQCCSLLLPKDVDIDALNRDLPSDIRVFGVQRVTPSFDSRMNCEARTYSYTLPTIAFANYNDQVEMNDFRLSAEQFQKVNQTLQLFVGNTNFHNFTVDKQHFDRSSTRKIHAISCSEPFVLDGVEFARVTVKGQSFMMHQIRKMMGFTLAVVRGIVPCDFLPRALGKENFNVPTAPGLGLVLECLHFDKYNRQFGSVHGEIDWTKYESDIEQFRRNQIDPIIIRTEIERQEMVDWLNYLVNHSYDGSEERLLLEETYDDSWGEDPEFWKEVTQESKVE